MGDTLLRSKDLQERLLEKADITPDDVRRLREEVEHLKKTADEAVAWAEQQLRKQEKGKA